VAIFICPTRRQVAKYPYKPASPDTQTYVNIDLTPSSLIARCDYAICAGGKQRDKTVEGPESLQAGDDPQYWSKDQNSTLYNIIKSSTGVCYLRSEVVPAQITDGLSNTYLVGEKYIDRLYYVSGQSAGDNQGWDVGFDRDIVRWVCDPAVDEDASKKASEAKYLLQRDGALKKSNGQPDDTSGRRIFGGPHSSVWHVVFCDGSVRPLNYDVDAKVHGRLGTRNDSKPLDQSKYE
jgi:hypothetical protein